MILVEEAWWDRALGVSGGLLGVDFRGLLPQLFRQVDFRVSLQPGSGKGVGWHQHSLGDLGFWDLVVGMFGHHHYPFLRLSRLRLRGIFQFVQPHRRRRVGLSPWGGNPPQFLVPIGQPQLLSCLWDTPRARLGAAGPNLLRCGSPAPPMRRTGCSGRRSISIETRRDMYGE